MAEQKAETPKLKFKGPWRVVATQQGQYNQFLMDIGMVFDLLTYRDGTYPVAMRLVIKKDDHGQPMRGYTDKDVFLPEAWDEEPIIGKDGIVVHRDFALDMGNRAMKTGPKKGETIRVGWMKRVPESVAIGMYPVDADGIIQAKFWDKRAMLPPAFDVGYAPWRPNKMDAKRNHAPMLEHYPDPVPDDDEQDESAVA